jgi:hypothetical protein
MITLHAQRNYGTNVREMSFSYNLKVFRDVETSFRNDVGKQSGLLGSAGHTATKEFFFSNLNLPPQHQLLEC